MNKSILFIALLAVSYATIEDSAMPGSWSKYQFSSGFQNDVSSPLAMIFHKLSTQLSKQSICEINFIEVQTQVVNGMNFKIQFTYSQEGYLKVGKTFAYVSFSGQTCEIHEVELDQESPVSKNVNGGWKDYPIKNGFEQDVNSPLNMVVAELSKELSGLNAQFIKFESIQSQIVSGIKFNISFQYKMNNGDFQVGTCFAVVRSWEKFVQINQLSVKAVSSDITGGWEVYEIEGNYQANPHNPLTIAYKELAKMLKSEDKEFVKFNQVQQQVVNGLNMKMTFTYKVNGKEMVGDCKIYVNFIESKAELQEINFNEVKLMEQIDGGWSSYNYSSNQLTNSSSPISFAYKNLVQTLEGKNIKLVQINDVQSQVVSGVNFKINFVYRQNKTLKIGQAIIYVQSWNQVVKMSHLELQGKVSQI